MTRSSTPLQTLFRTPTVAMPVARALADVASRRGLLLSNTLRRLGISQAELRDLTARLEWSRFLELLDALGYQLGGAEALGAAALHFFESAPELTQLASRFPTPASLMRFLYGVVHGVFFPGVETSLTALDERRFEVAFTVVPGDRHHALFAVVVASLARGVPRLLGCGDGLVQWRLTPDGGQFTLEFPPAPPRAPLGAAALETLRHLGLTYLETYGREVPAARDTACTRFLALLDELARPSLQHRVDELAVQWALTPRQADVLRLLVGGLSNKDIAQQLAISHRTVEIHLTALLQKSGAETRAQLLCRFWKGGA